MIISWVMLLSEQVPPKIWPPDEAAGPPRSFGRSAKAIPLSVRIVWILEGKRINRVPQKSRRVHLSDLLTELDKSELRNAIDGEEHVKLAVRMAKLAAVDVDVADVGKSTMHRRRVADRQARDAMTFKATIGARRFSSGI